MAEVSQYNISLKELAEIVLLKQGIKSGKWSAGVNFGIQVGNFGTPPDNQAKPAATIIIDGFVLTRMSDTQPIPKEMQSLIVDASELDSVKK